MPESSLGVRQGEAFPVYLTVKNVGGDLVPQPAGSPTIEVAFIDPDTKVRRVPVTRTAMGIIEPGRHFFVWRVAKDEVPTNHIIVLQAILEDEVAAASDASFSITSLLQNASFVLNVQVLEDEGVCFPEVMAEGPKCKRQPILPVSHFREVDIGLDDFAIEGAFRFGDFPHQVVDRRTIGRFNLTVGVGGVRSEDPGGGQAIRPGDPISPTTRRKRYRY